jgi:hypothetical protein
MVIILNLLPFLVSLGLGFIAYKIRKWWPIVVMVVFVLTYKLVQPSYLPKGVVERTQLPEFEQSGLVIQDVQRKPALTGVERDAKMQEDYTKSDKRRNEFVESLNR